MARITNTRSTVIAGTTFFKNYMTDHHYKYKDHFARTAKSHQLNHSNLTPTLQIADRLLLHLETDISEYLWRRLLLNLDTAVNHTEVK